MRIFTTFWKFTRLDFNPFNFNPFATLLINATRKMNTEREELKKLNTRLKNVEGQVRKLMVEISSISGEMHKILNQNTTISTVSKRHYSTDIVDMINPNDFLDDMEEAQPLKRPKTDHGEDYTFDGDHVVVYTDGACENNGKKGAKAGIGVWFGPNHPLNISAPVSGKPTNNNAEIQACIKAIDAAYNNGMKKLCIKTDSQFVISSMTSWIKKWKKNNWTLSGGGEVKNKTQFIKLDACCNKMDSVKWVHVAGHRGIIGNEAADQLARDGAMAYSS